MSIPGALGALTGTGGSGIQLSVKLDSLQKWDAWVREVHGFAMRDHILEYLIKPDNVHRSDWYRPVEPTPIMTTLASNIRSGEAEAIKATPARMRKAIR